MSGFRHNRQKTSCSVCGNAHLGTEQQVTRQTWETGRRATVCIPLWQRMDQRLTWENDREGERGVADDVC